MDKTKDTIQFNSSVFRKLNTWFWDDTMPAKFIPFTKYKINAWHISKSLMLFTIFAIPFFHEETFNKPVDYLILGSAWILSFNLFYNKILKLI